MNRPKALNALTYAMCEKITELLLEWQDNSEIGAVLIDGAGDRAFCAGASFEELKNISNKEDGKDFFMGFAKVINASRKCPKLIIGRVQGKAVGGGVGMACATDYCYATKYASVKLSELEIGIGPFVVGPAVERKIGTSAMSQLAINATSWRSAQWAKNSGLYASVFDTAEEMDEEIDALANVLAESNPEAMMLLKKIFWEGTEHWDELLIERAELSGKLVLSDFTKETLKKFN